MVLSAAQHSQIAKAYDRAAADETLPPQARAAFAKKALWFRMLARIRGKKEETMAASKEKPPQEARPEAASGFTQSQVGR